jgi:hypothetical protein
MTQTRRLAAILAADVAGYSRLMGADEEGALERTLDPDKGGRHVWHNLAHSIGFRGNIPESPRTPKILKKLRNYEHFNISKTSE